MKASAACRAVTSAGMRGATAMAAARWCMAQPEPSARSSRAVCTRRVNCVVLSMPGIKAVSTRMGKALAGGVASAGSNQQAQQQPQPQERAA